MWIEVVGGIAGLPSTISFRKYFCPSTVLYEFTSRYDHILHFLVKSTISVQGSNFWGHDSYNFLIYTNRIRGCWFQSDE